MIRYRVFSKEVVVDNMDEEVALTCMSMLQQQNPSIQYNIEAYTWSHVEKRMGRDPDLH